MPKVKKIRAPALSNPTSQSQQQLHNRHEPLGQVLQDDIHRQQYTTTKRTIRRSLQDPHRFQKNNPAAAAAVRNHALPEDGGDRTATTTGNNDEAMLLDEKTTQRILQLSKEQQLEMIQQQADVIIAPVQPSRTKTTHTNNNDDSDDDDDDDPYNDDDRRPAIKGLMDDDDDDWQTHGNENDDDNGRSGYVIEDPVGGYVSMVDGVQMGLSAEDEALVASMMQGNNEERRTLADIILEKIEEKEVERNRQLQQQQHNTTDIDNDISTTQLPPKVVEVYTDIGKILSRYTSGKLPKAFKVIPSLSNWEDVLYLTRPDHWTPQAMYAATRIFASNLNPKMATKFYNLVLLDGVRNDIYTHKKLNYHYFMALKKSVYKPQSFFKGILLPLCQENCTLREAAIVASVLQRVSIPVHHSAVAIHKLALQEKYSGASSIFIKTLLNKKYSLPAPVIGSVVRHFANFLNSEPNSVVTILPVLWHQALLVFVQRYKNEIQDEARDIIRRVMKKHFHPKITPEIRRELFGAQAWNEERKMISTETTNMEL
jgi:essential nuclear protein 1